MFTPDFFSSLCYFVFSLMVLFIAPLCRLFFLSNLSLSLFVLFPVSLFLPLCLSFPSSLSLFLPHFLSFFPFLSPWLPLLLSSLLSFSSLFLSFYAFYLFPLPLISARCFSSLPISKKPHFSNQ
uniref:Uncharacterized protein n=1 Tax=Cacopsylla melanoneura TaxID=428564 RepID=A0A8D9EC14_9HEMI